MSIQYSTGFNPLKISEFDKVNLTYDAQGVIASCPASQSTPIDFKVVSDHMITGAQLLVSGATWGDSVNFQVVDKDGKYYPANTVLNQFITNWYIQSDSQIQLDKDLVYPAKIPDGVYLRAIYNSVGVTNPQMAINYKLHKVMF